MIIVRDAGSELNGRRQETMPTRAIQRQCLRRNTSLTVRVTTKVNGCRLRCMCPASWTVGACNAVGFVAVEAAGTCQP